MKRTARVVAVVSAATGLMSFLTLGNALVVKDAALNAIGMAIAASCLVALAVSLLALAATSARGQARGIRDLPQPSAETAPRGYGCAKLSVGLVIVLGLYLGVPLYALLRGVAVSPAFMVVFCLLSLTGFWLVVFHRRRRVLLDAVGVMLAALTVTAAILIVRDGGRTGEGTVERIAGGETVTVTLTDGEGGRTASVGICISARLQPPRNDAPDVICRLTDADGRATFRVKPGTYYIHLDLRSQEEYSFDPKYPQGHIIWEVRPQSTNELEFMVTPGR